jgi:Astacin (Peptidase family M12A)
LSFFKKKKSSAQAQRNVVTEGLQEIERRTCVRFVARTTQTDYVEIINGGGCYSRLGRTGGRQEISLQRNGCVSRGTVMHEFIHALG